MTEAQFVSYAHNATAFPSLLILWFFTMLVLFLVGFFSVSNKEKFLTIFFFTFIASGIVLCFLLFLPNTTQVVITFFKDLFF